MAFETSILQNGEWTTRTLDVNTVLRHYDQQDQEASPNAIEIERAPTLGLLTQTVIRSPVVHWILPVKLRDSDTNDVAFIGDDFVQIKELRPDGHLWDVVRKDNFGARIRNALVIGSMEAFLRDHERQIRTIHTKDEDDHDSMKIDVNPNDDTPNKNIVPPQVILLQLDSGDSVFLMLRESGNGSLGFVSSRHRVSRTMLKMQPGAHLAVDPSSRYIAIGCSESLFAIYALKSTRELQEQYSTGSTVRYVEAERHIYLQGVIHKMVFLYPSHDDEEHVILLVLMIRKGKTRMLLYEWETDSDLRDVRANSRRGHLLEETRQMPLLIVPLTIKSAFILVCASAMSICRDILQGSPRFIDVNDQIDPPTSLFHGSGIPLWTSWARPVRRQDYRANHDDIYIVREDGFIKFIETDCSEEDLVKTEMNIGPLSKNCGSALACLDYLLCNAENGDLLVTSGDCCAGAAYLIKAREAPTITELFQNWSPAQDFITKSPDQLVIKDHEQTPLVRTARDFVPQPDRVFTCAGRGMNGTITEFRHGLEAGIGLEMAYDTQIMDIWMLPSDIDGLEADGGSLFLLSLGDRSSVLYLSSDATDIIELEPRSTNFDLNSRTIAASMHGRYQIQVTEHSIVFVSETSVQRLSKDDLLGVHEFGSFQGFGEKIDLAVLHENIVLFTTQIGHVSYLQALDLESTDAMHNKHPIPLATGSRNLGRYSPNATCLSVGLVAQKVCAITAEYDRGSIRLLFQPLHITESPRILNLSSSHMKQHTRTEAFVSIAVAFSSPEHFVLVCGARNGFLVTLEVEESSFQIVRACYDRIGGTPVIVKQNEYPISKNILFVNCDLKIYALVVPVTTSGSSGLAPRRERKIFQIFMTDARKPIIQQPPVNSIGMLEPNLSGGTDGGLLLISGSQILLAGLSTQPKAVPRCIPIGGSPSRLLYSRSLGCLIVAASVNGRCTLLFVDPETGEDLSSPIDKKNGSPVDFVPGLGSFNERVLRLFEWSYVKSGKTWQFIIVCTSTGRLLIISTQNGDTAHLKSTELTADRQRKIRYFALHRFKCGKPVYSVAGFDEGLFYCSGDTLYCETLDIVEKRFKRVAEYVLPSPALDLEYKDGRIYALTAAHSLEILKLGGDTALEPSSANGPGLKIIRTHGDQVTRNSLHHRILSPTLRSSIDLVSDKSCSIVGLWATHNTRADTLETIFEAQLSCSILRFRTSRIRPTWDITWVSNDRLEDPGLMPSLAGYPEILGLSIDGSLFNFTILDLAAWKFLRFLINLAKQSPRLCEFTYVQDALLLEPVQEPKIMMHVDGDILRRCLDESNLDELLRIGHGTEEAAALQTKFVELLHGLHRETMEKTVDLNACIERAYKDLDLFLRPVL